MWCAVDRIGGSCPAAEVAMLVIERSSSGVTNMPAPDAPMVGVDAMTRLLKEVGCDYETLTINLGV